MHVGRLGDIISGLVRNNQDLMIDLLTQSLDHLRAHPTGIVLLKCRSNRHRSVGVATALKIACVISGLAVDLVHCEAGTQWHSMRCGGRCNRCRYGDWNDIEDIIGRLRSCYRAVGITPQMMNDPLSRVRDTQSSAAPVVPVSRPMAPPAPLMPPPPPPAPSPRSAMPFPRDIRDDPVPASLPSSSSETAVLREMREMRNLVDRLTLAIDRRRSPSRRSRRRRSRTRSRSHGRGRSRRSRSRRSRSRRSRSRSSRTRRRRSMSVPEPRTPPRAPPVRAPPVPPPWALGENDPVGQFPGDRSCGHQSEIWGVMRALHHWDSRLTYGRRFQSSELKIADLELWCGRKSHDCVLWIGPETDPARNSGGRNVRVNVKFRGKVDSTSVKFPRWMGGWRKSAFKYEHGAWQMVEHEVSMTHRTMLRGDNIKVVVVCQPVDEHRSVYMGSALGRVERVPPTPPKPGRNKCILTPKKLSRNHVPPKADDSHDLKDEHVVAKAIKNELNDSSSSSDESDDPGDNQSVSKKDQVSTSVPIDAAKQTSDPIMKPTGEHPIGLTVKTEQHDTPLVCNVGFGPLPEPKSSGLHVLSPESEGKHVTMSRRRKREFEANIDQMNFHDKIMQGMLGLKHYPDPVAPNVLVFTSHPMIFTHECVRTIDVGWSGEHINSDAMDGCWDLMTGMDFIVFVIRYDDEHDHGTQSLEQGHARLLTEAQAYCEASGAKWLNVDYLDTYRWDQYDVQEPPHIMGADIGVTCNDELVHMQMGCWCEGTNTEDNPGMAYEDLFTSNFLDLILSMSEDIHIDRMTRTAFVAEVAEDAGEREYLDSVETQEDLDPGDRSEELLTDEAFLDKVEVPGLPQQEADRRAAWRRLPQRVRVAIRRLHRQFGHCPRNVLINLLRSARVDKNYVTAAQLHRCTICEDNAPKRKTHKTSLPYEYRFNACLGIDLLEVSDSSGQKYTCLNMVDMGTTFQLVHVIRKGKNASSAQVLKALCNRWFSWCGYPKRIVCDRGLHFRGVVTAFCAKHGIEVRTVPLETPEGIGRVERHGGIAKAMWRKVCAEVQAEELDQVQEGLNEVCIVKNGSARHGGFSPSQWVTGQNPRGAPSIVNEESLANLGAFEDQVDPESVFMIQHHARAEARKAFVYLDTSKRIQRAMLRNANPISMDYAVGDIVCFRKDTNTGGERTKWSVASRVIGHEGSRDVWVLCENTPVLVSTHNLRPANDSEALARSILNGEEIVPSEILGDDQKFVDMRTSAQETEETQDMPTIFEESEQLLQPAENVPIPIDEDEGELEEEEAASSSNRPLRTTSQRRTAIVPGDVLRNVRPRVGTLTSTEAGSGVGTGTATPEERPVAWPNLQDHLNDLPDSLRRHFDAQRDEGHTANVGTVEMPKAPMGLRSKFVSFMAQRFEEVGSPTETNQPEEKHVEKTLIYEKERPEMRKLIDEARDAEWQKYIRYAAAVPLSEAEGTDLVNQGHTLIPSKWVDVDKNAHRSHCDDYRPKVKSRLVSCGNFEDQSNLRTDAPTSDAETHHLVIAFAAIHCVPLHAVDITSAYFQAAPLDRVVLMRQPRGGLGKLRHGQLLLVRVPVYGLCDSGRGFFKRLDGEARGVGFAASQIFPAFYYLNVHEDVSGNEANKEGSASADGWMVRTVAVMTTHVDDLMIAYLPEGKSQVEKLMSQFDVGTKEQDDFRYCGKQITTNNDGISIDVSDNTMKIKPIRVEPGRQNSDPLTPSEMSQYRSVVGSLSWIARQGRPDLLYIVSRLQSEVKGANIATLKDANKAVDLAMASVKDTKLNFPYSLMSWSELGVLSISDASFSNEPGMKSQQGRCHFLAPFSQLKKPGQTTFTVYPVAFSSTTIKRVCRATLQCEAYSLQASMEAGDRIRALLVEMKGCLPPDLKDWENIARQHAPQLHVSDCMSLVNHLNSELLSKCQDKRLEIEMRSIRQSLRDEDDILTHVKFVQGGDRLVWAHTSTMLADCLTKKMRADLLLAVLKGNSYTIELNKKTKKSVSDS